VVGSVTVFRRDPAVGINPWCLEADLFADTLASYRLGSSIAVDGDVVVAGDLPASGDNAVGCAYQFRYDGTGWIEQSKFTASDGHPRDSFGSAVAVQGDRILVGAAGNDNHGSNAGAVYEFVDLAGLHLDVEPLCVQALDTITFSSYCGQPGSPLLLAVVLVEYSAGSFPGFWIVYSGSFDVAHSFDLSFPVPPGLLPVSTDVTFQSLGLGVSGGLVLSNPVRVTFK
jgi:hypothetical protein